MRARKWLLSGAMKFKAGEGGRISSTRGAFRQTWMALLVLVVLLPSCQTASNGGSLPAKEQPTRLTAGVSQLEEWFARNDKLPRALALLSPT